MLESSQEIAGSTPAGGTDPAAGCTRRRTSARAGHRPGSPGSSPGRQADTEASPPEAGRGPGTTRCDPSRHGLVAQSAERLVEARGAAVRTRPGPLRVRSSADRAPASGAGDRGFESRRTRAGSHRAIRDHPPGASASGGYGVWRSRERAPFGTVRSQVRALSLRRSGSSRTWCPWLSGRAPGCGPGGRGFDPRRTPHALPRAVHPMDAQCAGGCRPPVRAHPERPAGRAGSTPASAQGPQGLRDRHGWWRVRGRPGLSEARGSSPRRTRLPKRVPSPAVGATGCARTAAPRPSGPVEKWSSRRPVTAEAAGSSPAGIAEVVRSSHRPGRTLSGPLRRNGAASPRQHDGPCSRLLSGRCRFDPGPRHARAPSGSDITNRLETPRPRIGPAIRSWEAPAASSNERTAPCRSAP